MKYLKKIHLMGTILMNSISLSFILYNFLGTPRPPFDELIQRLVHQRTVGHGSPVISIDIPSGWHVEDGDVTGESIKPDMLVRL